MPGVLLTRPNASSSDLALRLAKQGWRTLERPLLTIECRDCPAADLLQLDRFDHVIFVSQHAARCGLRQLEAYWPQWPLVHFYAVGRATASVMATWDLAPTVPGSENSEGLLALTQLRSLTDERVLIVRGNGGRELLAETLRERGALVAYLEVYERVAEHYPQLAGELDLYGITHVVLTSAAALDLLSGTLRSEELATLEAVAASPRIAEVAEAAGLKVAAVANGASDQALFSALAELAK